MKPPNVLLKMAAVFSAVLLVGGFVGYRAGAFGWLLGNNPRSDHMGGSKSHRIYIPDTPQQSTPAESKPAATLMGGSKSISVSPLIVPPTSVKPATEPPTTSQPAKSPD